MKTATRYGDLTSWSAACISALAIIPSVTPEANPSIARRAPRRHDRSFVQTLPASDTLAPKTSTRPCAFARSYACCGTEAADLRRSCSRDIGVTARGRGAVRSDRDEAYYSRPIALRHPIVFYEGHLPAFSFNTLVKQGAGPAGHRRRARDAVRARHRSARVARPQRMPVRATCSGRPAQAVRAVCGEADRQVLEALRARRPRSAGRSAARSRRGGLRDPRARGDAPGDAALHVASPAVRCRSSAPAGYAPRVGRARRRAANGSRFPRGRATLGVDRERCRSAGTTSIRARPPTSPAFSIERHNVTNARFLEFVEAGGYRDPQWWRPRTGSGSSASDRASAVLGARRRSLVLARHVRSVPLPLVVAGVREPGRSHGVCAVARRAAADRSRISARRLRHPSAASGRIRGATTRRHAAHGVFDFASWDPQPAGSHPAGAQRVGRRRSRRQRLGVDEHARSRRFPGSRRCRRIPSTPRTSSTASIRDEGRVAGHGARTAAADVPQLVPRALSLCLRDVPLRQAT